jgi:hypothetical protein
MECILKTHSILETDHELVQDRSPGEDWRDPLLDDILIGHEQELANCLTVGKPAFDLP